jgi:uncharacterized protein YcgI (DUF1989 family)
VTSRPDTSRPAGARDHARSMEGTRVASMPTVPASAARDLPPGVAPADVLWDETLGGGSYATRRLPRGARLRITNLDGVANAAFVVHNAEQPAERLDVPDTVKVQWSAYLGAGSLLLSDMGRTLMAVLEDGSGQHDVFCGTTARERFLVGLAKHGLGRRDLGQCLSWFRGVRVDPDGKLELVRRDPAPGEHVLLRADLDVLVAVVNAAHPLDEAPPPAEARVRLTAWRGAPAGPDDPIRASTPERRRAYENVDEYLLGREGAGR